MDQQDRHVPSWELPTLQPPQAEKQAQPEEPQYLPLSQTLRLYAGWLLSWYGLVYMVGAFRRAGSLPWAPSFFDSLFLSPLTLHFAFATYLYLLVGTVHKALGGGVLKGLFAAVLWGIGEWAFWSFS